MQHMDGNGISGGQPARLGGILILYPLIQECELVICSRQQHHLYPIQLYCLVNSHPCLLWGRVVQSAEDPILTHEEYSLLFIRLTWPSSPSQCLQIHVLGATANQIRQNSSASLGTEAYCGCWLHIRDLKRGQSAAALSRFQPLGK
jgi:hypothetical protein